MLRGVVEVQVAGPIARFALSVPPGSSSHARPGPAHADFGGDLVAEEPSSDAPSLRGPTPANCTAVADGLESVSHVVATLKDDLEAWRTRSLAGLDVIYVYLDGFTLRVRSAGRVVSVPVRA